LFVIHFQIAAINPVTGRTILPPTNNQTCDLLVMGVVEGDGDGSGEYRIYTRISSLDSYRIFKTLGS